MPDAQKQRWLKYGANVAVSCALVVLLAGLAVYLVQRTPRRIDTTAAGLYSLRPQTLAAIRENAKPVKLVSLYRSRDADDPAAQASGERERAQIVRDLLLEYERKGRNISVEFVDPKSQPAKEDALVREVEQKYGGEVKAYRAFLDEYQLQHERIVQACEAEVNALSKLEIPRSVDRETARTLSDIVLTVEAFPERLARLQEGIERERKKKIPDYQAMAALVRERIEALRERLAAIVERAGAAKDQPSLPAAIKGYLAESLPRYERLVATCDEVIKEVDGLGELKLDTLRRSLQQRDPILVLGENDIRILAFEQVWKAAAERRGPGGGGEARLKPKFAGEQMITSAILAVNEPEKRKVAFVRAGGPPLTDPGFPPFVPGGPMSVIAERLRDYNFDVVERDFSGQWAMQAQMQGMPAGPEATDEALKSAIWVVLAFGGQQAAPGAPDPVATALQKHLESGGRALVILAPQASGYDAVLSAFGITAHAHAIAVHEPIPAADAANPDPLADARREQPVFDLRDYGDHPITRPLRSLESWLLPIVPVAVASPPPEGVEVAPLVPLVGPGGVKVWGETDVRGLTQGAAADFDEGTDLPGPLHAGAAAAKGDGARVVVIGAGRFAFNAELTEPDPDLYRQDLNVARFPANGELFTNSIFWLAGMDTMIAISPSAMEVSRIGPISPGMLNFWRVGVLLIGIPGAVVAAGLMVYLRRRD